MDKLLREHDKRILNKIESKLKNRNRVDISLNEYEEMKNKADKTSFALQSKIDFLIRIIKRIGIPIEIVDIINTNSIGTIYNDDILTNKRRYRIEFTVDLHKANTEQIEENVSRMRMGLEPQKQDGE